MRAVLLLALLAVPGFLSAQEKQVPKTYRVKFSGPGKKVVMNIQNAEVSIQGYDGEEIVIEGKGMQPVPKEAEGLRPVGGGGTDNSGVNLTVQTEGDVMTISTSIRQEGLSYSIKLPKTLGLNWKSVGRAFEQDELSISNMQGEIEVRTMSSSINLKDITGPVVAYSTMGKITAQFSTVNQDKPISLSTGHEAIDVTLPADTKATVALSCFNGNAFTDFDIKPLPADQTKKNALATVQVTGYGKPATAAAGATKPGTVGIQGKLDGVQNDAAALQLHAQAIRGQAQSFAQSLSSDHVYVGGNDFYIADDRATRGIINAPGVNISLNTSMGNIYLRKKK
ncbi:DUF4097 family beta strand repeat-containing protein [Siphonobacter aquaeclarae]|uniref:Adhesin domain-containing protein n=1 Tax=Siphonobacter aquaeclarae TaxID=563176 RepID=A0A1G9WWS3_9BACT|nr:hypothetical protein [Siphonobacter aquaeclarae]SDM88636.1 hypothetical protein SAMN04488090_4458 [Siphonobacter aquaeclarae]